MDKIVKHENGIKQLDYLNIAKGIGIILVVIGHCIPDYSTDSGVSDPLLRMIYNAIYSFHMPLFFFISGYLTSRIAIKVQQQSTLNIIKKKFNRLLIPYFFVGICYTPFKLLLSSFANKPYDISNIWAIFIGVNPDYELWFLYALFIINCIVGLLDYKSSKFNLLLAAILALFSPIMPQVTGNLFFFLLGMYFRDNYSKYLERINTDVLAFLMLTFVGSNYLLYQMGYKWAHMITALSGIFICIKVSECIEQQTISKKLKNLLILLGSYSMDIYILSDIVKIPFRIILWNKMHLYFTSFYVCSFFSILISFFISKYFIRNNKILKKLILGM